MLIQLIKEFQNLENPEQAKINRKFFKTGKGEYSEEDIFIGLKAQQIENFAKKYSEIPLNEVQKLLDSKIHEHKMCAIRILIIRYKKDKKNIFEFYLKNLKKINNWDLVDISAPKIIGDYLLNKDKSIIYKLVQSKNLWLRRIAIVSTYSFIKKNKFQDTLKISNTLLQDKQDLIHKSIGWMLREIGKRDKIVLENFLKKNYLKMPRITLRYAIEKFDEEKRKEYLKGKI
jgi:3-methyladenine DNA glycosylase AlkD